MSDQKIVGNKEDDFKNTSGVIENYKNLALQFFRIKSKQNCIDNIQKIIEELSSKSQFNMMLKVFILLGEIYFFFKEYNLCIETMLKAKTLANQIKNLSYKMIAYKYMGESFHSLGNHELALNCYKKQLDIGWKLNSVSIELDAYDKIGLEYYYLEDLDKATYYHERMTRAKSEGKLSAVRINQPRSSFHSQGSQMISNIILNEFAKLNFDKQRLSPLISSQKNCNPNHSRSGFVPLTASVKKEDFRKKKIDTKLIDELKLSFVDLPSPRGQSVSKTTMLLPFFSEEDQIQSKYSANEAKYTNLRNCRPVVEYLAKQQHKEMKLNQNIRDRKMSLHEWVKYRLSDKFMDLLEGLDIKHLGQKAQMGKTQKPTFAISLSHLSQNRIPKYSQVDYTRIKNIEKNLKEIKI